ncbi:P-loop containing nucleoside triphosphate hydrolase protein [Sarocladium strictum]
MAPGITEGGSSSTQGPLKVNSGGSQVNGKGRLDPTSKERHATSTTNPFGPSLGTKEGPPDPILEEPQPENATVPETMFETEHSKILFEAIDQMHSLGAGQLDIPQLVIVGSQSCGKSSLLRTLTDIPFPVASGRCTRFPIRIVSKRTKPGTKNSYHITIEPGADIRGLNLAPVEVLEYHESGETLTVDEFERIINQVAHEEMGIRPGRHETAVNFVSNVLKVDLSGPNRSQFSIVDLPGTFSSAYDVNDAEKVAVEAMTLHYMRQPENIVICVVDAGTDVSNQDIFSMSMREVDSQRLVGVITQCDRARSDHETVLFAKGEIAAHQLRMRNGWFVTGNLSRPDVLLQSPEKRAPTEDDIFRRAPWTQIQESRRGSAALRSHLGDILSLRIRETFPTLETTIKERLRFSLKQKSDLGNERVTLASQRQFLNKKAEKFCAQAKLALDRPGLSGDPAKELRQITRQYDDEYDCFMRELGHSNRFENIDINPRTTLEQKLAGETKAVEQVRDQTRALYEDQRRPNIANLDVYRDFEEVGSEHDLLALIGDKLSTFQARQLPGVVNPDIYPVIYRQQTLKWNGIAHTHLERVSKAVWRCIEAILNDVCPETEDTILLNRGFRDILRAKFDATHESALKELEKYCKLETQPNLLQTADPKFASELDSCRKLRFFESFHEFDQSRVTGAAAMESFLHGFSLIHSTTTQNIINDVHDVLKTYYKVSLESFIRHIRNIVIEGFLSNEEGPLFALSTDFILSLSEEEVKRLATENDNTVAMRERLLQDINKLSQALAIAEKAREQTERLIVR